jgi:O-methyltransferase involved in polyketide biosynthesis
LKQFPATNIISLGAGYDSTYFWLKNLNLLSEVCYIEMDYPDVIKRKIKVIKSTQKLSDLIG